MKESSNVTIPTINVNSDNIDQTVTTLRKTCVETGFFYVDGHSIPIDLLDAVFEQSKELFDLPLSEKKLLSNKVNNRGYFSFEEETLDVSVQTKRGDTKEGFDFGKHIPKEDPEYDLTKFRCPNQYPNSSNCSLTDPSKFRKIMDKYYDEMSTLAIKLVRLIALSLDLPEKYFDSYFQNPLASIRLLHYSDEKSDPENGLFSCGAHSDYGMITILLTDSNPGLQVYYQDEWIPVPPKRGSFIVNLGDMLERWTNGLFKSTLHRVVSNGKQERYSVPYFYDPDFDALVECLDGCCGEGNPKKYESVTMGEFLKAKYRETFKDFEKTFKNATSTI